MKNFIKDESGSESVEMALLVPLILSMFIFAIYINQFYHAKIGTSIAANEALRVAITQTTKKKANTQARKKIQQVCEQNDLVCTDSKNRKSNNTNMTPISASSWKIGKPATIKIKTKRGIWISLNYTATALVEEDGS